MIAQSSRRVPFAVLRRTPRALLAGLLWAFGAVPSACDSDAGTESAVRFCADPGAACVGATDQDLAFGNVPLNRDTTKSLTFVHDLSVALPVTGVRIELDGEGSSPFDVVALCVTRAAAAVPADAGPAGDTVGVPDAGPAVDVPGRADAALASDTPAERSGDAPASADAGAAGSSDGANAAADFCASGEDFIDPLTDQDISLAKHDTLRVVVAFAPKEIKAFAASLVVKFGTPDPDLASQRALGGGGCIGGPGEPATPVLSVPESLTASLSGRGIEAEVECVDADDDQFLTGPPNLLCRPSDCDDAAPTCGADCTTDVDQDGQRDCDDPCVDGDQDGYGFSHLPSNGTCRDVDCRDDVASCTTDCSDSDGDDVPDCADPCVDPDGDGHGTGSGCAGPDCDEGTGLCNVDCVTDIDQDDARDCDDGCVDIDDDGYGEGTACEGPDCADSVPECDTDCTTDTDGDDRRDCDDPCVDVDGDGYGAGPDCVYPDCDDAAPLCTTDCVTDVDGDDVYDCADGCLDADRDNFGVGSACLGPDCDDDHSTCRTNCEDVDGNGVAECVDGCLDFDGDHFGEGPRCNCGLVDCADCDPYVPTCGADCAADLDVDGLVDCKDPCLDADADLWGTEDVAFVAYCAALAEDGLPLHPNCAFGCVGLDCDDAVRTCTDDCETDIDADSVYDCADDCLDGDRDEYGVGTAFGNVCLGADCDDRFPTCIDDCATDADGDGYPDCRDVCVDIDEDGWGSIHADFVAWCDAESDAGREADPNCNFPCTGEDCDDAQPLCRGDCTTDADNDEARDCDDPCVDGDRDDYGVGPGCQGPDCLDTAATCTLDCATDVDADAVPDCTDPCIDFDQDGFGSGTPAGHSCPDDCLDTAALCTTDCTDGDLDGRPDCNDSCIDDDGDTFCANAAPFDCDDAVPTCWGGAGANGCLADVDGDGVRDCQDPCVDADGDRYGWTNLTSGGQCLGADCDDAFPTCTADCTTNADTDLFPDCRDSCIDRDGDTFGSTGGPPTTCTALDCNDNDALVNPSRPERCNGIDDDCDTATDATDYELYADDPQNCEMQQGVCNGARKPARLCQSGIWLECDTAAYAAHSSHYQRNVETSCDGRDNDCNGTLNGGVDEDFTFTDWNGSSRRVSESCGTGACTGGSVVCATATTTRCSTASQSSGERCDRIDNDCDGSTDAADAADLLTNDRQNCEQQLGVCSGCTKPAALCVNGSWTACTAATYQACRPGVYETAELTCNDQTSTDNDCDGNANCRDGDCNGDQGPAGQTCEPNGETLCADHQDNDGDGQSDCGDPQCNTRTCDDTFQCTDGDVCSAGSCRGTPHNERCTDSNECTNDTCSATTGCVFTNRTNGTECGTRSCSGLVWRKQTCQTGQCSGSADVENCADTEECTNDACNAVNGCSHSNVANGTECGARYCESLVYRKRTCNAGTCSTSAQVENCDDTNTCTTDNCNATTGGCSHTNNTLQCAAATCTTDGGNPTFHPARTCSGGVCPGDVPQNCNDGVLCTDDSCSTTAGCQHANNTVVCAAAECRTDAGQLRFHRERRCAAGTCEAYTPVSCNDSNVCTDDTCNTTTGCVQTNNSAECAAGACDGAGNLTYHARRVCSGGSCPADSPVNCNDSNLCTDDTCNASTGCGNTNNAVECAAGLCDGAGGLTYHARRLCSGGSCPADSPVSCNDGEFCTDDACSTTSGCSNANNTAQCGEGYCVGLTYYAPAFCAGGTCPGASGVDCSDTNACTGDSCVSASGCAHSETCCADNLNNDNDATTDCADADCADAVMTTTTCAAPSAIFPSLPRARCQPAGEAICYDNCDNDRDTLVDCADPGCVNRCCDTGKRCQGTGNACTESGVVAESTASGNCADGLDNDCDGCIDGADSGCGGSGCPGRMAAQLAGGRPADSGVPTAAAALPAAPLVFWYSPGFEQFPAWPLRDGRQRAASAPTVRAGFADALPDAALTAAVWADPDGRLSLLLWQAAGEGPTGCGVDVQLGPGFAVEGEISRALGLDPDSGLLRFERLKGAPNAVVLGPVEPAAFCVAFVPRACRGGAPVLRLFSGNAAESAYDVAIDRDLWLCAAFAEP